jgi:uncharacterized membrane protein
MLVVSLGVNVLFGAALATRQLRAVFAPPRPVQVASPAGRPPAAASLTAAIQELPAEDAKILRAAITAAGPTLRPAQRAARAAMDQVRALLERDPVDAEALRQAMAAAQKARGEVAALTGEVFLSAMPQISAEGRRKLAGMGPPR